MIARAASLAAAAQGAHSANGSPRLTTPADIATRAAGNVFGLLFGASNAALRRLSTHLRSVRMRGPPESPRGSAPNCCPLLAGLPRTGATLR